MQGGIHLLENAKYVPKNSFNSKFYTYLLNSS